MEKIIKKFKLNNEGVSLVEVLVTIAMVALMAGTLLNGFLRGMSVNSNARVIQNGTTVAQDKAEEFKALPLEQLLTMYSANYEDDEAGLGIHKFKNIAVTGPNNEEFLVDIKLDSTTYNAGNGNKLDLNNINLPGMSSLHGSNAIMLYKQYAAVDELLVGVFGANLDPDTLNALYTDAKRQNLSKATDILIECTYDGSVDKYYYDIKLTMKYSYTYPGTGDVVTVEEVKTVEDISYGPDERHTMYLVCPIFDIYTRDIDGDISYSTDKININFSFIGEPEYIKNVYFYLAEQEVNNKIYSVKKQKIHPMNVKINTLDLTTYNMESSNLKLYTNVGNYTDGLTNLTFKDKESGIALYDMTVQVREKGEENIVAEFTTTK